MISLSAGTYFLSISTFFFLQNSTDYIATSSMIIAATRAKCYLMICILYNSYLFLENPLPVFLLLVLVISSLVIIQITHGRSPEHSSESHCHNAHTSPNEQNN